MAVQDHGLPTRRVRTAPFASSSGTRAVRREGPARGRTCSTRRPTSLARSHGCAPRRRSPTELAGGASPSWPSITDTTGAPPASSPAIAVAARSRVSAPGTSAGASTGRPHAGPRARPGPRAGSERRGSNLRVEAVILDGHADCLEGAPYAGKPRLLQRPRVESAAHGRRARVLAGGRPRSPGRPACASADEVSTPRARTLLEIRHRR